MDDAGEWHDDPLIMDERYLAVHVKGRGPVVFSACSHAGIINVMHDAAAVAGTKGTLLDADSSAAVRVPQGDNTSSASCRQRHERTTWFRRHSISH